jgi:hypothetical protein
MHAEDMDIVVDITAEDITDHERILAIALIAALVYGFQVSGDGTTGTAGYGFRATGGSIS